jgi:monoamine oxidase
MKNSIIIIGAGAAGLMAAHILSKAGKKVIVLEARNRTGGRIHTLSDELFFKNTELGAEFVHGDLPVTLNLLKEASIGFRSADAEMWRYDNGRFEENSMVIDEWDLLIEKLDQLQKDVPVWDFVEDQFPGDEYANLRSGVWSFVSGYDTADPHTASAFALRNEWKNEDQGAQHRIEGGYCAVINYLANACKKAGGEIFLNAVAKEVWWEKDHVKVTTSDGTHYEAKQLLIAAPLGVLKAKNGEIGAISITPGLPEHTKAIQQMGFGAVIKLLFEFNTTFWLDDQMVAMAGKNIAKMGYLFSDEEIPTWWTQTPDHSNVLTGWIGGPAAAGKLHMTDTQLLDQGLQSLANIFNRDFEELKGKLIAYRIINWTADPFTRGSYAYDTVEDALFFAGDFLYEGTAMGTVEAALTSGKDVAERILSF